VHLGELEAAVYLEVNVRRSHPVGTSGIRSGLYGLDPIATILTRSNIDAIDEVRIERRRIFVLTMRVATESVGLPVRDAHPLDRFTIEAEYRSRDPDDLPLCYPVQTTDLRSGRFAGPDDASSGNKDREFGRAPGAGLASRALSSSSRASVFRRKAGGLHNRSPAVEIGFDQSRELRRCLLDGVYGKLGQGDVEAVAVHDRAGRRIEADHRSGRRMGRD